MTQSNQIAEISLLSCLIKFPLKYYEIEPYLSSDLFTNEFTQSLFFIISSIYTVDQSDSISKQKIWSYAKSLGFNNFNDISNGGTLLEEVFEIKCQENDTEEYFKQIYKAKLVSSIIQDFRDLTQYLKSTPDGPVQIVEKIEDVLLKYADQIAEKNRGISQLTKDAFKLADCYADNPGDIGLDVGFPIWQNLIGGVRNGTLTFVAATSSAGKSAIGLNIAIYMASKYNIPVLICDSEMTEEQQKVRALSRFTGIPIPIIERGFWKKEYDELLGIGFDPAEAERLKYYKEIMMSESVRKDCESLPISYLSINSMQIGSSLPFIRQWIMKHGGSNNDSKTNKCLVIYDYVKLNSPEELRGNVKDYMAIAFTVSTLKNLTTRYNIPIIAFGQTNNERDEGYRQVAGSKWIVNLSDSVSILGKKTQDQITIDPNGNSMIKIYKARHGAGLFGGYINFNLEGNICKFTEVNMVEQELRRTDDHD